MIFIIMVNGNGRPPACKMQEARTGNYIPIWSGLMGKGQHGHEGCMGLILMHQSARAQAMPPFTIVIVPGSDNCLCIKSPDRGRLPA